jgi:hypothetical protein
MKLGLVLDTSLPNYSEWSDVLFDSLKRALLSNGSDTMDEMGSNDMSSYDSSAAPPSSESGSGLSVSLLVRLTLQVMERYMVMKTSSGQVVMTPMSPQLMDSARSELQAAFTSLVAPNNAIVALFSKRIGKALLMMLIASQSGNSGNSGSHSHVGASVGAASAPAVMQTGINVLSVNSTSPARTMGGDTYATPQSHLPQVSLVGLIEPSKLAAMSLQSKPQVSASCIMHDMCVILISINGAS